MQRKKEKIISEIKKGNLVILPTDTVYGLLCRYDKEDSIEKIYELKKRDKKKPLKKRNFRWTWQGTTCFEYKTSNVEALEENFEQKIVS